MVRSCPALPDNPGIPLRNSSGCHDILIIVPSMFKSPRGFIGPANEELISRNRKNKNVGKYGNFISLQLSILHPSCRRVCGGGWRLKSDTNYSFYDLLFDVHCFQSHGDLSGDPLLPPKPSIHRQLFSPAISVALYPRTLP